MKLWKKNILLLIVVVLLAVIPLFIAKNAKFGGSDVQAKQEITAIDKNYKPWFSPLFKPASAEVESLLFSLQAAIGAGILGFGFGRLSAKYIPSEKN